ncbi:helix-turn-helix domain-containing protein [Allopusillimonas soli]|uniref:Helix-turn-helix domain-containing protein n=1 Tax=Allopusillimonas soli TaxID=659016 RepID=A0A853F4M1_9BURK|nr:helix-turn-helix domain-containing protein [Allopusillimonas soli]NYT35425.1 helix-turn-helix domain-containing protein [Allopusillimonas soli]
MTTVHTPRPDGARWSTITSDDVDDHAHNLSRWEQDYNQFSAGAFSGRITQLWLPHTQLFLESTSQVLHQSCAAWRDALWFGIPVSDTAGGRQARLATRHIPSNGLALQRGGAQFELFTPADFDIIGIVIQERLLARYLQDVEHLDSHDMLKRQGILVVDPLAKADVCRALLRMLHATRGAHARRSYHRLEERILSCLAPLIVPAEPEAHRASPRQARRHHVIERARELVLALPAEDISIPQLCRALHVSRRTLQYCFQDVVGMPPLRYLRIVKLNQVRRMLRHSDGCHDPVTQAAMSWGFHHLGQFAADYRQIFGELPSETAGRHVND